MAKLGDDVDIDIGKLVESRMLVQANSGGGKSWALRRLLEQTYSGVQHIVIDHDGEFHTLREKYDYVLAGKGGDCPADIKSASLLARRLLELRVSAIIDIYELGTQRPEFVRRFLDSLVNAPRDLWHPVLVVIDEAHIYCPEVGSAVSANAVKDLMTLGRKRGFAGVLATQRISKLNKDAAAEANNKLIGRSSLDIDMKRAASELGFVSREDTQSLRTLKPGEFYAFGPAISGEVRQFKVGPVKTTHLRAGQRAALPAAPSTKIKKVLGQLADLPHEAEEEAKTAGELRLRVKALEAELRAAKKAEPEAKVVETPVITKGDLQAIEKLVERGDKVLGKSHDIARDLSAKLGESNNELSTALSGLRALIQALLTQANHKPVERLPKKEVPRNHAQLRELANLPPKPVKPRPESNGEMSKGERIVLSTLLQYPEGVSDAHLAVLTGYKATSRREFMRSLKAKGYAETRGELHFSTDAGAEVLPDFEVLPVGDELLKHWMNSSKMAAGEKRILEVFVQAHPTAITNEAVEEATGYKATSVREYRRQLIARKLVVEDGRGLAKASDILFG